MILLVEDDAADVELAKLGFFSHGFTQELAFAGDGVEALEYLCAANARGRPLPAAIVTDLKMPRMDGFGLIRRLKSDSRFCSIPIVVLTSSDDEGDIGRVMEQGAVLHFRKPSNLDDYAAIVEKINALVARAGSNFIQ